MATINLTPAQIQAAKIRQLILLAQQNVEKAKAEKKAKELESQKALVSPFLDMPVPEVPQPSDSFLWKWKQKEAIDLKEKIKQLQAENAAKNQPNKPIFLWNKEQQQAIDLALEGKDFCLIGAAGTGKSSTERGIIEALIANNLVTPLKISTKRLKAGQLGIVVTAFTRAAVKASKRNLSADIPCITTHKLLEFEPVFYEIVDPVTKESKKTMRFEPQRDAINSIRGLKLVIIDESSMMDIDLHYKLKIACPGATFIYVGDIQQLPPVYGTAILGYKMLTLPVVELTQVYRQALESPIIRLAHRILSGKPLPPEETKEYEKPGELKFHFLKKRVQGWDCQVQVKKFFASLCKQGGFDPTNSVILIPFNEEFGTIELNKGFAQTFGEMNNAVVYEIISGFQTHYFAVGDRVLYDKQEGIIKEIIPNALYAGKRPHKESKFLNRWGHYIASDEERLDEQNLKMSEEDIDRMISLASSTDDEDRKNQASHVLKIAPILDSDEIEDQSTWWQAKTAGEINNVSFSYCLTVHKSQGSEWENVYFIIHNSHYTMCNREMLYTAVTRARKNLYIISDCRSSATKKDSPFEVGIERQRIKGDTLTEKAEFFKGKLDGNEKLLEKLI